MKMLTLPITWTEIEKDKATTNNLETKRNKVNIQN